MRSEGLLKHLAICAVIAVVFYAASFAWIEHRRAVKGPWRVEFKADAAGTPSLLITQAILKISQTIAFPGQSVRPANFSRAIVFNQSSPDLPFGELIYQDPTFLPGTVTMRLFGHEVDLLPRVLAVDKKEYPWRAGTVIKVR